MTAPREGGDTTAVASEPPQRAGATREPPAWVLDAALGLTAWGAAYTELTRPTLTLVGVTIAVVDVVVGALFVLRRSPQPVTASLVDHALCLASVPVSALALALAPPPAEWPRAATIGFALAALGALASLLALGRSFAVLPAWRGLADRGPFAWIRHPLYAFELAMVAAACAASLRLAAVGVMVLAVALVVLRIHVEERVLSQRDAYAAYQRRVRWRLLPRVW